MAEQEGCTCAPGEGDDYGKGDGICRKCLERSIRYKLAMNRQCPLCKQMLPESED